MQALVNLIDHGMSLQEAVEAPRVWTEGNALEVEQAVPEGVRAKLAALGHKVLAVPTVAGGMNGIQFHDDGTHDRRRLLARRRHAGRHRRRARAGRGAVRAGLTARWADGLHDLCATLGICFCRRASAAQQTP